MTLPRARVHTSALRTWRARLLTERTALLAFAIVMTAIFVFPFTLLFAPKDRPERTVALQRAPTMASPAPAARRCVRHAPSPEPGVGALPPPLPTR